MNDINNRTRNVQMWRTNLGFWDLGLETWFTSTLRDYFRCFETSVLLSGWELACFICNSLIIEIAFLRCWRVRSFPIVNAANVYENVSTISSNTSHWDPNNKGEICGSTMRLHRPRHIDILRESRVTNEHVRRTTPCISANYYRAE